MGGPGSLGGLTTRNPLRGQTLASGESRGQVTCIATRAAASQGRWKQVMCRHFRGSNPLWHAVGMPQALPGQPTMRP